MIFYQDEYYDTFLFKVAKYNCSFEIIEFLLKLGNNPIYLIKTEILFYIFLYLMEILKLLIYDKS